ncbi:MAG: Gfo/Idh/MocA family oxidoreductase [Dehalococcoidia bacterium]
MVEPLRVGFIGAGANTTLRHIPGLQAIEGVELVAVCNRSEASGQRVADAHGIDRVTIDPDDIFGADDIDAVCIGTWPYMHRDFVVRALEAGKHVLVEARMAMNASEARDMLAASQAHPDLVAQIVPAPFDFKSWRTIRRLVADGSLGMIREVHVTSMNGNSLREAPPHWREQQRYSGANVMIMGILAEAVQRWLGPFERVAADAETFITSRIDGDSDQPVTLDVPDSLGVIGRLESGARLTMRLSTVANATVEANGVSVYGSNGTLHWRVGDSMSFAPVGGEVAPLDPDEGTAHGWQVEADFVASIRDGAPVELTNFEDGVRYMQFTEAVYRSWNEGGRVVRLDEV